VIERLLAAERALAESDLAGAGRLFRQVADADPRNAIAVAGLAAVAHRSGDVAGAIRLAEIALSIDPEDAAARRLLTKLRASVPEQAQGRAPDQVPAEPPRSALVRWLQRLFGRRA
jgi:predicted TPR repeat methyltransferase